MNLLERLFPGKQPKPNPIAEQIRRRQERVERELEALRARMVDPYKRRGNGGSGQVAR